MPVIQGNNRAFTIVFLWAGVTPDQRFSALAGAGEERANMLSLPVSSLSVFTHNSAWCPCLAAQGKEFPHRIVKVRYHQICIFTPAHQENGGMFAMILLGFTLQLIRM